MKRVINRKRETPGTTQTRVMRNGHVGALSVGSRSSRRASDYPDEKPPVCGFRLILAQKSH